ncbi:serine hydroxymethyltransferase [Desulfomonile tiedjei]|uniref:Serine hydroxymethyltransferase n=1 Tax=Desulfomonile tiedjei (strain ATCC 49306 / DSM 6799 / DCB-1) TaxID=706587 RepID=I4C2G5_DESTA|nr:serine hydroxymethyltransferase [Desulfomonile tiedjei]AFM23756.1 glycine/serine hydroxymethyltransferase [Desulfomonile tiedjei DSM 6799]
MTALQQTDPEIYKLLACERERQENRLELIASENFTSPAVMEAQGSIFTNKYAEGYPGKRYYGGCVHADVVEELARTRGRALFGCDHINVQPHSGTQANMAVYFTAMKPGDAYLGMNLAHGGHLSMGHPKNFSGIIYHVIPYAVRADDHRIDYDQVRDLARKHKPRMIIAGASAYPRIIRYDLFAEIAAEVGAILMADIAHVAGLVAAGQHPSPFPHADFVTTTTHKTLRGPRGGLVMCKQQYAAALDSCIFPGMQGGPLMHVIAAKAVALGEAMTQQFKEYQARVVQNAKALASGLLEEGFRLISGGTDNHLVLIDLTDKGINGAQAQEYLESAGITVNKNSIPFDPLPPGKASGIRIGTPAVTTRNMGVEEMRLIAGMISKVLTQYANEDVVTRTRNEVLELCRQFPLYPQNGNGILHG